MLRESKGGLGAYAYFLEVKAPYVGLHKITNTWKSYESFAINRDRKAVKLRERSYTNLGWGTTKMGTRSKSGLEKVFTPA